MENNNVIEWGEIVNTHGVRGELKVMPFVEFKKLSKQVKSLDIGKKSYNIAAVREHKFVERDNEALNELSTYVSLPSGIYAARPGRHDDILMTRALALHAIGDLKYTIPYWKPQSDEEEIRELRRAFPSPPAPFGGWL